MPVRSQLTPTSMKLLVVDPIRYMTDMAGRIETPALLLDLLDGCDATQASDIYVGSVRKCRAEQLITTRLELGCLSPPEADDVGEELGLLGCPVSVGSVDLVVDLACINKQHLVSPLGVLLAPVKEPERDGQGDGVEHVPTDGDDHVYANGPR